MVFIVSKVRSKLTFSITVKISKSGQYSFYFLKSTLCRYTFHSRLISVLSKLSSAIILSSPRPLLPTICFTDTIYSYRIATEAFTAPGGKSASSITLLAGGECAYFVYNGFVSARLCKVGIRTYQWSHSRQHQTSCTSTTHWHKSRCARSRGFSTVSSAIPGLMQWRR